MTTPAPWRKVQLGLLGDFKNGVNFGKDKMGEGIRLINVKDIFSDIPKINFDSLDKVALSDQKGIEKFFVKANDIFFVRSSVKRDGIGLSIMSLKDDNETIHCGFVIRFRLTNPDVNSQFLAYILRSPHYRKTIIGLSSGTAIINISQDSLSSLLVDLPPPQIQNKIASILSTYDDLIENNRHRIRLMEQSARLLYREWFVHLRFPGHEHVRIIAGVPKGWRCEKLQEVADINAISLNNGFQGKIEYIDISSVTTGQINETTFYEFENAPGRARRVVRHGDIIWSCVRPNRESHAIIWHPHKNLIASTGFAVISPIEIPTSYIYQAITTKDFVGYLSNNARGVAYPAVTGKDFGSADILIPTHSLLEQFDEIVKPTMEQINVLKIQNNKLKEARDLLLPRLMNGEITV